MEIAILLMVLIPPTHGGFRTPVDKQQLLIALFGKPCDCGGGIQKNQPTSFTHSIDCVDKTAYLTYVSQHGGGYRQEWTCVTKPQTIPSVNGQPGPCPNNCKMLTQMHSTCYQTSQSCSQGDAVYLTAVQNREYQGSTGGDWDTLPQGHNKYAQASCTGKVGEQVCWPQNAPIHISDGGGPSDRAREAIVQTKINQLIAHQYPSLNYHPLALPKTRAVDLHTQTNNILEATHKVLNSSNPSLANDCWLCMTIGSPMPAAIPADNFSTLPSLNCSLSPPFRTQPVGFNSSHCYQGSFQNNSFDLDVGFITFSDCTNTTNHTEPLCPAPGQVFLCGNNLAYTALPQNWTGLCVQANLLPDISIISGDTPVPVPSLDYIAGRSKRALQFIPLLVGLGVARATATGSADLGIAIDKYNKLSHQLIDDVQTLSGTINDLQDQIDSLAEVALQNRRGLDLLTAEKGRICLVLQEHCCFYANKSGIVRNKIKDLQEDLLRRRKELQENPFRTGLNGFLPYLLPILGLLLGLLLILSFGPWAFKRLTSFIKQQVDSALAKPIQVHYHRLAVDDEYVAKNGYSDFLLEGTA